MSANNRLQRGVDPYADADEANARSGIIPFTYPNTEYAAATAIQLISPFSGRLRELSRIVQTLTAGAGVVTVAINGTTVGTHAVGDASAAGSKGTTRFPDVDSGTGANIVKKGDAITLTSDATPTAGALYGYIHIDAATRNPV